MSPKGTTKKRTEKGGVLEIDVNLNSKNPELKPLLDEINPILLKILHVVTKNHDTGTQGVLTPNFSKILFSKIKPSTKMFHKIT